jgi:hypothetical protein
MKTYMMLGKGDPLRIKKWLNKTVVLVDLSKSKFCIILGDFLLPQPGRSLHRIFMFRIHTVREGTAIVVKQSSRLNFRLEDTNIDKSVYSIYM